MRLLIIAVALALTACASPDYSAYVKHSAEASVARSNALRDIAAKNGETSAVAAVMALAMGASQSQMQPPPQNQALSWAQVLVPGLTSVAGMRYQYLSSTVQSNNAAAVAQNTNSTFGSIAGLIQAPTVTLSGSGNLGTGTYTPPNVTSPTVITPVTVVEPVVPNVPVVVTNP